MILSSLHLHRNCITSDMIGSSIPNVWPVNSSLKNKYTQDLFSENVDIYFSAHDTFLE